MIELKPLSLIKVYNQVIMGDGTPVEVMTWCVGDNLEEAIDKFFSRRKNRRKIPTKILEVVTPNIRVVTPQLPISLDKIPTLPLGGRGF